MSTDDVIWRRKEIIKALVELPEFEEAFKSLKAEIAEEMFATPDKIKRDELYNQAIVVDNIRGKFVKIANEVRMLRHGKS